MVLGLALDSVGLTASAALWKHEVASLALDEPTKADCANPGVVQETSLIGFRHLPPEKGKADQLILLVEAMLNDRGKHYRDLDIIAVNRGPGSFTGIRSTVALARGLALAIECPVIGVTSHEALASALTMSTSLAEDGGSGHVLIAVDARRGQVYRQIFDMAMTPISEIEAEAPMETARMLMTGRWQLSGSGTGLIMACLGDTDADVSVVPGDNLDARAVAVAAKRWALRGGVAKPGFDVKPLYIRPPDAIQPRPLVLPRDQTAGVVA